MTKVKVLGFQENLWWPNWIFFMYNVKSQELNLDNYLTRKLCERASVFKYIYFGHLELQVALTGRKKPVLGKRLPITFLMQIMILNHIKLDSKILINNQMYRREVYSLLSRLGPTQRRTKWRNCRLTPKLQTTNAMGCLGCKQAAEYPKMEFLFYAVKNLPSYPVT